jgi:hypothetical protein
MTFSELKKGLIKSASGLLPQRRSRFRPQRGRRQDRRRGRQRPRRRRLRRLRVRCQLRSPEAGRRGPHQLRQPGVDVIKLFKAVRAGLHNGNYRSKLVPFETHKYFLHLKKALA